MDYVTDTDLRENLARYMDEAVVAARRSSSPARASPPW